MFIKCEEGFADADFNFLVKYLTWLDGEIFKIDSDIKNSNDPDSDGLCEHGEYLIGHGFVAIQIYIASTYPQCVKNKKIALDIGFKVIDELTLIAILNAGANYYKHRDEWKNVIYIDKENGNIVYRDVDKLKGDAEKTINTITQVTPWAEYTLSNLLAELLKKIYCF